MKKLKAFAMASICLFFTNSYSQNYDAQEVELQQKYFNIRDHFHKSHIFVGNHYYNKDYYNNNPKKDYTEGTSIPFDKDIDPVTTEAWRCQFEIGSAFGNCARNSTWLNSGDGTIKIGWYLVYLATEYKLTGDAGKDTREILNEIYYALN